MTGARNASVCGPDVPRAGMLVGWKDALQRSGYLRGGKSAAWYCCKIAADIGESAFEELCHRAPANGLIAFGHMNGEVARRWQGETRATVRKMRFGQRWAAEGESLRCGFCNSQMAGEGEGGCEESGG